MYIPNPKFGPIDSRILVYLGTLACNMYIFSLIFYTRGNKEFILSIFSFVTVALLSCLFIRSLYKCTHQHSEIETLTKNLDQQQKNVRQMEKQKSDFLAVLSDKLRTPLQVIHGYSSMILEGTFGTLETEAQTAIEKIFNDSTKMIGLVESLVTETSNEAGDTLGAHVGAVALARNGIWKLRVPILNFLMAITTFILLAQIILHNSLTGIILTVLITILGVLAGFFLSNEMKHEPESTDSIENLVRDLGTVTERAEELRKEKLILLSRIADDLRLPLVEAIDESWQLNQGNRGEISSEAKDAVIKIFEMKRPLIATITELVDTLNPQDQTAK